MAKNSASHQHRRVSYLKPKIDTILNGYVAVNEVSVSDAINGILKNHFATLPEADRQKYLQASNKVAHSKNTY